MSDAGWYHNKAAECGRMAAAASDKATRDSLVRDQGNWTEIAELIEKTEAAVKLSKSK